MLMIKNATNYKSHWHCVYHLKYHLVLITKYRRKCFTKPMLVRLESLCKEQCQIWDIECIEFGFGNAREALLMMLVDDGNESNSNREALFRKDLEYIAIAAGEHKLYKSLMVVIFAEKVRDFGEPLFINTRKSAQHEEEFGFEAEDNMTELQKTDPDAPANAVGVKTKVYTKESSDAERTKKSLIKIYDTNEKKLRIVEIEDTDL